MYTVTNGCLLSYAEAFVLVIISGIPAFCTFYIDTVIKSRFSSTLQYGISHQEGPRRPTSRHRVPSNQTPCIQLEH